MANACCTKYAVSIFNRPENIKGRKFWNSITWPKPEENFSSREKGLPD